MGGVSGHAGLFSDADSLNILNQLMLRGGAYYGTAIFAPETVNEFTSVHDSLRYQLGFSNASTYSSLKDCVPENTLCHTGWTGTFSLIDKQNNLSIVLLTNKRHSPITDGDFEGAAYETGKYYGIVCAIYEGLKLR
jgi:CubicO group peptidase (beta-lactamase class C family)